jgi:DNA-directed RNA polymerase subunit M/transcription elongation factor TFIIS
MEQRDDTEPDDQICPNCGRKLTLIGSLPKIDERPRTRIYKCIACVKVFKFPPTN